MNVEELFETEDEETQDDLDVIIEARLVLQNGCRDCGQIEIAPGDRYLADDMYSILCPKCAGFWNPDAEDDEAWSE
jgi:hypothetical protein